jgi:uncharacterized protein
MIFAGRMNEMTMEKVEQQVRELLQHDASGHDWYHIDRVRKLAMQLQREEGGDAFIIEMAALLHDVPDEKLNDSAEAGMKKLERILASVQISDKDKEHILAIIANMSYKGGNGGEVTTLEGKIVQDADRLDALGAIGIARTFAYGGKKGDLMYDPAIQIRDKMSVEEYRNGKSTSLNHFYEKLFKLKDTMNTKAGRRIAEERHLFMEQFVNEFMKEWNGNE